MLAQSSSLTFLLIMALLLLGNYVRTADAIPVPDQISQSKQSNGSGRNVEKQNMDGSGNQSAQSQQTNVNGDNVSNQNQEQGGATPYYQHSPMDRNVIKLPTDTPIMPDSEHLMNNGLLMEPANARYMPGFEHLMNNGLLMEPVNARYMPGFKHLMNNGQSMEP